MAAGTARGSSQCEKAAKGLLVLLDTSSHCGRKIAMLAGRGPRGGVKTEVTGAGGQGTDWGTPEQLQGPAPPITDARFLLAWLTSAASGAPVQLVQSGVRLAEGAEVLSSQQGLGARKVGLGPVVAPPRPQGQPDTHRFCWHHIAPGAGLLPLHRLPGGKSLIRPGRQRCLWYNTRQGGSCREPGLLGALPHTKPGPGMDIPVTGGA